jgi:hypothetical protein
MVTHSGWIPYQAFAGGFCRFFTRRSMVQGVNRRYMGKLMRAACLWFTLRPGATKYGESQPVTRKPRSDSPRLNDAEAGLLVKALPAMSAMLLRSAAAHSIGKYATGWLL